MLKKCALSFLAFTILFGPALGKNLDLNNVAEKEGENTEVKKL